MDINHLSLHSCVVDSSLQQSPASSPKLAQHQALKPAASSGAAYHSAAPLHPSRQLTSPTADGITILDPTPHQFGPGLRLLTSEVESTSSSASSYVAEGARFLPTNSAVKEEPDCEAKVQLSAATQSEVPAPPDISLPVDKIYPLVISEYYTNPVLFSEDMKEKVTAQCRRCGRPVTGWWAPRLVTSNFITHLKSCSMELYQHFLDTKKRCGWAARRYTVKLHASVGQPSPVWKSVPAQSVSSPYVPPQTEPETLKVSSVEGVTAFNPARPNVQLLRALATFAAQELRPRSSLYSGSVCRLLRSVDKRLELPAEAEFCQFIDEHQHTIQSLNFAGLPPLDQSVVLLSLHGRTNEEPSGCLAVYWNCFIAGGSFHKRPFSVRRYTSSQAALLHSAHHLEACRERQAFLSSSKQRYPASHGILVLSVDPSSYLRLPVSCDGPSDAGQPELPQRVVLASGAALRRVDDFSRRLWRIFARAVEQTAPLGRLVGLALQRPMWAAGADEPGAGAEGVLAVRHLRQLAAAIEALGGPGSAPLPAETGDPRAALEEVLSAGRYFESALHRLHRPGVTSGSRLPLLLGLQKKFAAGAGAEAASGLHAALVAGLEAALGAEAADTPAGDTSLSLLATFADPQYKLFWVEDAAQEGRYRDRIVKHLTSRAPKAKEPADATAAAEPGHEASDGLLDFVAKRRRLAISSAGCDWPVMDEVQTYLANREEAGPLDFWANARHQENYPNVYRLHLEVHAVPVSCLDTSAALGLTHELLTRVAVDPEWRRESDETVESLVLAKCHGYEFEK